MKDTDINKIIGRNIRAYRESKGWTLEELAEKSGYNVNTKKSSMSKIENGKMDIPTSRLVAIADALGIDICDLAREDAGQEVLKQRTCELIEECYGKESYTAVQKFLKLDADDRQDIVDLMDSKLKREKYQKEKEAINA